MATRTGYCKVPHFEIHLRNDTSFVKKFGRKVIDADGEYSYCRGYSGNRFVSVPVEHHELASEIIAAYPMERTAVIERLPGKYPGGARVEYVKKGDAFSPDMDRIRRQIREHGESVALEKKERDEAKRRRIRRCLALISALKASGCTNEFVTDEIKLLEIALKRDRES